MSPYRAGVLLHMLQSDDQAPPLPGPAGGTDGGADANGPGYGVVAGVAVIAVHGMLVQRTGLACPIDGVTGYDGIRLNVLAALADAAVDAIVLDVDSEGGETAGCLDLADTIRAARGRKPIWAILSEDAYAAGYVLASAADRVTVPRTGGVGGIGVIAVHADLSRAIARAGMTVTLVTHGDQKADLAPTAPLSRGARARLQADVDTVAGLVNRTVAANRGMRAAAVDALQGGLFRGAAGVRAGLADAVMAPNAPFRALHRTLG